MKLDPTRTIIHRFPYATMAKPTGPDALLIGDTVALGQPGQDNEPLLQGTITEILGTDRYKVEITDIEGRVFRYSVPRDLIILVRRADA